MGVVGVDGYIQRPDGKEAPLQYTNENSPTAGYFTGLDPKTQDPRYGRGNQTNPLFPQRRGGDLTPGLTDERGECFHASPRTGNL